MCQTQPLRELDRPITVQAVGSNGRLFQFLVFQLNTTDLSGDDGIKNQVSCVIESYSTFSANVCEGSIVTVLQDMEL